MGDTGTALKMAWWVRVGTESRAKLPNHGLMEGSHPAKTGKLVEASGEDAGKRLEWADQITKKAVMKDALITTGSRAQPFLQGRGKTRRECGHRWAEAGGEARQQTEGRYAEARQ